MYGQYRDNVILKYDNSKLQEQFLAGYDLYLKNGLYFKELGLYPPQPHTSFRKIPCRKKNETYQGSGSAHL